MCSFKTEWEKSADSEGTTESERVLVRLARKTFLSLWSYPNVFSDEGKSHGKGDGKELVDLLVVFGNDVLLFSDKSCEFQNNTDIKVAWPRWYKRAILKSAKQLVGAESFLRRFPERIFIDKSCRTKFPVPLPNPSSARYYLIAVTRGGHEAASRYFGGGSSGSLMLNSSLDGRDHFDRPFEIGFPLGPDKFIHVLDEMTVDALLEELDTAPDFIDYLACKERYLKSAKIVHVAGEEELLARYMCSLKDGRHHLPEIPPDTEFVVHPEGDWEFYRASPQWDAKRKADEISYMWDGLIDHQASFVRAGTAIGLPEAPPESIDHERILRAFAAEPRLARRQLASHLRFALSKSESGKKFARISLSGDNLSRAYVFLTVPRPADDNYEVYREKRSSALFAYCHGVKLRFPQVTEAIGIASEPFTETMASQDFLYADLSEDLSPDESATLEELLVELDIFQTPDSDLNMMGFNTQEFPMPFSFEDTELMELDANSTMNRAERRRIASQIRKRNKKAAKTKSTRKR